MTRRSLTGTAMDPFAPIADGLIVFLDLETLEEVRVRELWPHQEEIIPTWIDLDHLAATGRPRFSNTQEEKSRQMGITWVTAYFIWWAHRPTRSWGSRSR